MAKPCPLTKPVHYWEDKLRANAYEIPAKDWGNRLLEGTNKTVCTPIQEKVAGIPQETDPDLPVSVQESLAEVWGSCGLLQGQGH